VTDNKSDSIEELSEFVLAWSAKHGKCLVGVTVEDGYNNDPSSHDFRNPEVITTVSASVLPLVMRRAQFSACFNICSNDDELLETMKHSTSAADLQSVIAMASALDKIRQRKEDEENGVVRTRITGSALSVIEGGLSAGAPQPKPLEAGPFAPPPEPPAS